MLHRFEYQTVNRVLFYFAAVLSMLCLAQIHNALVHYGKECYDAGYFDGAGIEEDEGSDFIGEDYLWKV